MGFMNAVVGGRSVGVPGIPKLLEDVHKRYGKLPWASLFDKPIALAEQGFTVFTAHGEIHRAKFGAFETLSENRRVFPARRQAFGSGNSVEKP